MRDTRNRIHFVWLVCLIVLCAPRQMLRPAVAAQPGDSAALMIGPPAPPRSTEAETPAQEIPATRGAPTVVDFLMSRVPLEEPHLEPATGEREKRLPDTESQSLGPMAAAPANTERSAASDKSASLTTGWFGRTLFATGLVIGLAILLRTGVRFISARGGGLASQLGAGGRAPSGMLMVLGRFPIARGQTLVLLKLDRRVLLLCQGPTGFQTLSEITDPEEVASLLVKSRDEEGESLTSRFTSMLHRAERDPSICGSVLEEIPNSTSPVVVDDDNWAVRERLGETTHREPGDPLSVLRQRLQSIHGGAV